MTSFQFGWRRLVGAGVIALATGCAALAQPAPLPPPTQTPAVPLTPAVKADPMVVPGFWDPRRRPERPDLSRITVVRFLTERMPAPRRDGQGSAAGLPQA